MKTLYTLFAMSLCALVSMPVAAQTVWDGPIMTFEKDNFADPLLPENQDMITDSVAITRGNGQGLFNAIKENSDADGDACAGPEPSGTEWAYGMAADFASLTFMPLADLIGCDFKNIVDGENIAVHLIDHDIYFDLTFTSWTTGMQGQPAGGGFAYERTTGVVVSVEDEMAEAELEVYPNPVQETFQISGLSGIQNFLIYNSRGQAVLQGTARSNAPVSIGALSQGIYFLRLENGDVLRLVKS